MCISIPYQINKINGSKAIVIDYANKNKVIDLKLLPNIKEGDWVLSLNNFAIEKISVIEAQQIIKLYKYE